MSRMPAATASTYSHPRRRPAAPAVSPESLIESLANMSLKKGVTFHSPTTNESDLLDPFEPDFLKPSRSMTARSTTCPQELEDLLVGAGERRMADFLAQVDQAVNNKSKEQLNSILSEPDVLPVPAFLVAGASLDSFPDLRDEDQAYDSGLGSSISSEETLKLGEEETEEEEEDSDQQAAAAGRTNNNTINKTRSASVTTRSMSSASSEGDADQAGLSKFATEQIHKYLIKPILAEPALKDFHRLIAQVPRRIGDRQITNLRDLEKTLIFLAPDYSRSPAAYLQFCETSIHCLHATVNGVHESDQRLPTDRPYTNHYFLDLVQQIRRYAQILAANRARQAEGEEVDEMEVTPQRLSLRGGLRGGASGPEDRPAELGYRTGDHFMSLATGRLSSTNDEAMSSKRPMTDAVDDDGVHRSMARRKKGELPKTYTCPVGGCDKLFNRPCDRTKHLKTHERPHKCSDDACEFSTKGFPTEKERDRHWADRHDPHAKTWECHYKQSDGCPYSSKREHNLKSHMEKAHQWEYVRSKGVKNASKPTRPGYKNKGKAAVKPRASVVSSSESTPFTRPSASPATFAHPSPPPSSISPYSAKPEISPAESSLEYDPTAYNPVAFDPYFADHFQTDIFSNQLGPMTNFPYTPSMSDGRRQSHLSSNNGTPLMPTPAMEFDYSSYETIPNTIPPTPQDLDFTHSIFNKNMTFPQDTTMMLGDNNNFNYGDNNNFLPGNVNNFEQSMQNQEHPALRNDLVFTTDYNSLNNTYGVDPNHNGQDFQLDQYLSNTDVNEPLFSDGNGMGEMGSQFINKDVNSNIYKHWFPEIN